MRPKMYCLVDEKQVICNAAKGVPRNVVINGTKMNVKNIDLYKRVLEARRKEMQSSKAASSASTIRLSISQRRSKPRHS